MAVYHRLRVAGVAQNAFHAIQAPSGRPILKIYSEYPSGKGVGCIARGIP